MSFLFSRSLKADLKSRRGPAWLSDSDLTLSSSDLRDSPDPDSSESVTAAAASPAPYPPVSYPPLWSSSSPNSWMLLRVLTAADTEPTSPRLAELSSAWLGAVCSGRGEGVVGVAGAGLVTSCPWWRGGAELEAELRMTRPPLPCSWVRDSTRPEPWWARGLAGPGPGPVVEDTWE